VNHLEEKATNLEGIDDEKAALIRKWIIKAEEVKVYMKVQRYLNPEGSSSLNHIMVPDDNLPPRIAQLWAE
jgi:hypothetical protein